MGSKPQGRNKIAGDRSSRIAACEDLAGSLFIRFWLLKFCAAIGLSTKKITKSTIGAVLYSAGKVVLEPLNTLHWCHKAGLQGKDDHQQAEVHQGCIFDLEEIFPVLTNFLETPRRAPAP